MVRTHGKPSTYSNGGCRCDLCKKANNRRMREQRARRNGVVPPGTEHGKSTTYTNYGCRCESCTAAHKVRLQIQRANRLKTPFDRVPHGLNGYRSYGCKCRVCTEAGVEYRKERREREARRA